MLGLLETGKALYVLTAVCLLGIMTRLATKNLYRRLLKESANMPLTKNKRLKEMKQRAENTYRMNQGMRDSGAWLEHQLNDMRFFGLTLNGWGSLSAQLTWLCLLLGGAGAFFAYWYRLDTYYVVMYGGGAVLMAMLTMLFDNGMVSGRREQLLSSLQDYMENILCPRLSKSLPEDGMGDETAETARNGSRGLTRLADRTPRSQRASAEQGLRGGGAAGIGAAGIGTAGIGTAGVGTVGLGSAGNGAAGMGMSDGGMVGAGMSGNAMSGNRMSGNGMSGTSPADSAGAATGGKRVSSGRLNRRDAAKATTAATAEATGAQDVDYLKRSLEQIAASREKNRAGGENWLKDLKPEEVQLIGDILKEYLA